jgi:hypothetical protein
MRPGTVIGALLIFAGVVALSVGRLFVHQPGEGRRSGPERSRSIPVPEIVAGLAILGGIVLIVANSRKTR